MCERQREKDKKEFSELAFNMDVYDDWSVGRAITVAIKTRT